MRTEISSRDEEVRTGQWRGEMRGGEGRRGGRGRQGEGRGRERKSGKDSR